MEHGSSKTHLSVEIFPINFTLIDVNKIKKTLKGTIEAIAESRRGQQEPPDG